MPARVNALPNTSSKRKIDPLLVVIFLAASILGALLVWRAKNWTVMTDELLYTDLARSVASTGLPFPHGRGEVFTHSQPIFPILISPIVGFFSMPTAYHLIAVFNAVAMASAAFPAYLLTKFTTRDRTAALLVALCTVAVPWLSFATKAMTDAVAYPMFIWAIYAIVRSAADGGIKRDGVALLTLLLAYLTRSHFVVLFAVWIAVVFVRFVAAAVAEDRSVASTFRALGKLPGAHPIPVASALLVILALVFKQQSVLGAYSTTAGSGYGGIVPSGVWHAMLTHLSMVAVGIGGLPLVLALPWICVALFRVDDARQNAAAIAITIATIVLLFVGASFDQRFSFSSQIFERYVFYIAPMLLVAAAALFTNPPRRLLAFLIPALAGVFLIGAVDHFGLDNELTVSLNQAFSPVQILQIALQKGSDVFGSSVALMLQVVAVLAGVGIYAAIENGRSRVALLATFLAIFVFGVFATAYTVPKVLAVQNKGLSTLVGPRTAAQKTWLRNELGADAKVAIFNGPFSDLDSVAPNRTNYDNAKWRDLEFWNGDVATFYGHVSTNPATATATIGPIHETVVDFDSGKIELRDDEPANYLVLAAGDPRFAPAVASRDDVLPAQYGFAIYRYLKPASAAWTTRDLTQHGSIPRSGAQLRLFGQPGSDTTGDVTVSIFTAGSKPRGKVFVAGKTPPPRREGGLTEYRLNESVPAGDHKDLSLKLTGGKAEIVRIVVRAAG